MHEQARLTQFQQYDGAYVQLNHSADVYVGKRHDEQFQVFQRKYWDCGTHPPVWLYMNDFMIKESLNMCLKL